MQKRRRILCLASIAWLGAFPAPTCGAEESGDSEEEKEEPYYSQLTRAIVRLEEHQSVCTPGREWAIEQNDSVGSAFFVRDNFEGENRYFIVTARHVVENRADLFARVRVEPDSDQEAVLTLPRDLWSFHPRPTPAGHFPVDVAVMRIPWMLFIKVFLNCPTGGKDGECGKKEKTEKNLENQLAASPSVMERAIFFGFPIGHVASQTAEPFARAGVVAYTAPDPDLKIGGRPVADNSMYYIDAPSFAGNSGGPVLKESLPLRGGVYLWGLVTGGSRFGKDYAVVTKPEMIAETLAHARPNAKLNEHGWSSKLPRLPVRCVADK